jgi:hypothetical protein
MADVQELLQQMQEQLIAQFQATVSQQNELIRHLSERLTAVEATPATTPEPASQLLPDSSQDLPLHTSSHTPSKASLSEKLPDPPLFAGKRKELTSFITQLRYKLEGNKDRFPTARSQFLYAQSRVGGDAAIILDPLYDREIATVQQLIQFLETSYGDPNRKASALARLGTLKQGNRSFISHFAEFRRIAADSDLNETGLIMQLKASLTTDLQRAMVGTVTPDTLNEYANQISRYDNDLRYIRGGNPRASSPAPRHPDAMDLSSLDYAPIGSKERERRIRKGLCLKCGSPKHISPDCKKSLPRMSPSKTNPREVNAVAKSPSYPRSDSRQPRSLRRQSPSSGHPPRNSPASSRTSSVSSSGSRDSKDRSRD